MHIVLLFGFAYFVCISGRSGVSNKCYHAKICVHDGKEKCGQDVDGKVRRFLDSCDMKEYNCLKGTDYTKTSPVKCHDLPSIKEKASEEFKKVDKMNSSVDMVHHAKDPKQNEGQTADEGEAIESYEVDEKVKAEEENRDVKLKGKEEYKKNSAVDTLETDMEENKNKNNESDKEDDIRKDETFVNNSADGAKDENVDDKAGEGFIKDGLRKVKPKINNMKKNHKLK